MLSFIGYAVLGLLFFGSLFAAVDFARKFLENPKNLWIQDWFAGVVAVIVIVGLCSVAGFAVFNLAKHFVQSVV